MLLRSSPLPSLVRLPVSCETAGSDTPCVICSKAAPPVLFLSKGSKRRAATRLRSSSTALALSPLASTLLIAEPSAVSLSRSAILYCPANLRMVPLTTRSAPTRRPVSTSHSPSQSASDLPLAFRSTSMFSLSIR